MILNLASVLLNLLSCVIIPGTIERRKPKIRERERERESERERERGGGERMRPSSWDNDAIRFNTIDSIFIYLLYKYGT